MREYHLGAVMREYHLVYPSGAVVIVEAENEEEAREIGFAFGALPEREEIPEKEAA